MCADVGADVVIDGGRESQVEEPVGVCPAGQGAQVGVELGEGGPFVIPAAQVGVSTEEGRQTLALVLRNLRDPSHKSGVKKGSIYCCCFFNPRLTFM